MQKPEVKVSVLAYREDGDYDYPSAICMNEDESLLFAELKPSIRADELDGMVQIIDMSTGDVKDEIRFGTNCYVTAMVEDDNVLYISLEKENGPLDVRGYVAAYDLAEGRIKYKTLDSNRVLNTLRVCENEERKYLFGVDYYQPLTFDIETGELLYTENSESYVVESFDLGNGNEALILRNGEMAFYVVDSGLIFGTNYFAFPFNEDVKHFRMAKGIFVFHSDKSKVIGVYKTAVNDKFEQLDSEPKYQEFSLECEEIDIPLHNCKIVKTMGNCCLYDENGNCIADLKDCRGYDEVNDRLIFEIFKQYYAAPVYSYEELLAAADEYLASKQ